MQNYVRMFHRVAIFCSSLMFGADGQKTVPLTTDLWVNVFNFLPLQDQYHLALTCKLLYAVSHNTLICARSGSAVDFDTESGLLNKVKNLFVTQRKANADIHCNSFCKKIAANQIGGSVTFYCSDDKQFNLFLESLKTNNCITQLNMSRGLLTDLTLTTLATNLMQCSSLKSLVLRENAVTHSGIISLLTLLPHLEELDISENFIGFVMDTEALHKGINPTCRFASDTELKTFTRAIGNLKRLHMNNCKLLGWQMDWLVDFLKTNTQLEMLCLNKNGINVSFQYKLIEAADTPGNPLKILTLYENDCATLLKTHITQLKRKDLQVGLPD